MPIQQEFAAKARGHVLAIIFVALAFGARLALAPALGERSPFLFFTLAVLATAAQHGTGPGLLAMFAGAAAGIWFIGQGLAVGPQAIDVWANVAAFLATSCGILWIAERLRRSRLAAAEAARDMAESALRLRESEDRLQRVNASLEAQVAERTADLQTANSQLEAFAYTVSHDLRAPLRGMEGFARILVDDFAEQLGHKGQRYARKIVSAAERMEGLIGDLLTFSRIQRAEISLRAIDLTQIVQTAADDARALVGVEAAKIQVDTPIPVVLAEPVLLRHAIANLLSNAVKFRRVGETAHVRVTSELRGELVRLVVEDQGIGISPEHLDRIFGVFERLHGQEAYPGTGIGLAIVKTGIERMGGLVGVESQEGKGSRFWVELRADKR